MRITRNNQPLWISLGAGLLAAVLIFLTGCEERITPQALRERNLPGDLERHEAAGLTLTSALTLEDALAIAMKHNLETTLLQRQQDIKKELATQSWLKLLPTMKFDYDHSERSQYNASSSVNLETGQEALSTSYSSDKDNHTHSITMMWSVLDFGLSFYAANQADKRTQIAELQLRRARQDLAMKVAGAFWEAVVSRTAAREAQELIKELEERDRKLRKRIKDKMIPKREGLNSRKDVLSLLMELKGFKHRAEQATEELVRLMGLRPGTQLTLADTVFPYVKKFDTYDVEALGEEALVKRPELFQEDLEEHISEYNTRIAVLKMFPNPSAVLRHDWDANPYLNANYWYTTSAKTSWDLLSIPQHLAEMRASKLQTDFVKQRRMSVAIGVLAQVHLSVIQYHDAAARAISSAKLNKVQQELYSVTEKMARQGTTNRANLLAAQIETFFSRVRYMESYAGLQQSKARIENTVGRMKDMSDRALPLKKIEKKVVESAEKPRMERPYGTDSAFVQGMPAVSRKRIKRTAQAN